MEPAKKRIDDSELQFGDVVLNYCDPIYQAVKNSPSDRYSSMQDHLVRLLVYAIFAKRIFVPANYVLTNDAFFGALKLAEELLEEGILVVHLHEDYESFCQLAQARQFERKRRIRAEYLDKASRYIKPFSPSNESALYHRRLMEDILPGGALRSLIPGAVRGKNADLFDKAAVSFESQDGSRKIFIETMQGYVPEHKALFARWASLRYYLTPMELETLRIRDLPFSAASLARRAGVMKLPALEDPEETGGLPEPMSTAANVMGVHMPIVISPNDARCLVQAALAARTQVPQAQEKFAGIVSAARSLEVQHELNGALQKALLTESISKERLKLSEHFVASVKQASLSMLVEMVLGRILGAIATAGSNVLSRKLEQNRQLNAAPWKVSYETLAREISGAKSRKDPSR